MWKWVARGSGWRIVRKRFETSTFLSWLLHELSKWSFTFAPNENPRSGFKTVFIFIVTRGWMTERNYAIYFFNNGWRPIFLKLKDQNSCQSCKSAAETKNKGTTSTKRHMKTNINFNLVGERQCLRRGLNPRPCAPCKTWCSTCRRLFVTLFFWSFVRPGTVANAQGP